MHNDRYGFTARRGRAKVKVHTCLYYIFKPYRVKVGTLKKVETLFELVFEGFTSGGYIMKYTPSSGYICAYPLASAAHFAIKYLIADNASIESRNIGPKTITAI